MSSIKYDFTISSLGPCKVQSPIQLSNVEGDFIANYVSEDEFVRYKMDAKLDDVIGPCTRGDLLEKAGPREKIFRITSYNVCYTKLLRLSPPLSLSFSPSVSPPRRKSRTP